MAQVPFEVRSKWHRFWLVDPLDWTKEFLHRTDDFTVNIALIENHQPTIGVIYAPVFDTLYYAFQNLGSFKQEHQTERPIQTVQVHKPIIAAISRRHGDGLVKRVIERIGECQLLQRGSSIKSCLVAAGEADFYPLLDRCQNGIWPLPNVSLKKQEEQYWMRTLRK